MHGRGEAMEWRSGFKLNPPGKGTTGTASYQNQKDFASKVQTGCSNAAKILQQKR